MDDGCMYACMDVCMYLCLYVSMYLCIYVFMYLCMHAYKIITNSVRRHDLTCKMNCCGQGMG